MRYCYALLVCFASILNVQAQERVFSEYEYDQVGNTTSITQDISGAAPSIDDFTPSVVRQSQVIQITVNGEGLRGATVANDSGVFSFSNTQSTNEQLTFTLTVDSDAEQGPSQISLSTGLGVVFFSLDILAELPELRVSPTPIAIQAGTTQALLVSLSRADILDHEIDVSISDESVVTVNETQINIESGQIKPNQAISLTAIANGSSRIQFESLSLGNYSYNISITDDVFVITPDVANNFISANVGVNKLFTPPPPELIQAGPFFAEQRVIRQTSTEPSIQSGESFSNNVGLLKGSFISSVTPNAIAQNTSSNITISGVGLSNVDAVSVIPDDNLTLGQLSLNADGQSLSLPIDVAENTDFSQRRIVLRQAEQVINPATPLADRFWVGGITPTVNSVAPIYFNRNDVRTVTVRGINLEAVTGIRFEPNDGVVFSNPEIAQGGQSLTFELQVLQFALIGPRQLILESSFQDSQAINIDASTLFVEDQPPVVISPVVAPVVGINKLTANQPIASNSTLYSQAVGVTRGAVLTSISPNRRSQGSSFTLSLEGVDLNAVVSAELFPADGITVGEFNPAIDGTSATLQLDIANDAAPITRQLRLSNGAEFIAALSGQDRFEVTLPQPQIESVSPLQIARDQSNITLTVRGQLLNDASQLSFTPSDGITVGSLTPSLDGSVVEAEISISDSASLGQRIVQLTTPGGNTESVVMLSNTIQVVQTIDSIVTPVLAPSVGVIREVTPQVETQEVQFLSTGVGIIKQATPEAIAQQRIGFSPQLGLTKGSVARVIQPDNIAIGSSAQTVQVIGTSLDDVTSVRTIPADGVILNGPAIISTDGTSVTFTVDVEQDADQTPRRLELLTDQGVIPFVMPQNGLLNVVGLTPQIESIDPIQEVRGASFTMTIRGLNFADVQSIQASPSNSIQFGTPVLTDDGRSLTVTVVIDENAANQQTVIQVITAAGESISVAMPANTFTVISE